MASFDNKKITTVAFISLAIIVFLSALFLIYQRYFSSQRLQNTNNNVSNTYKPGGPTTNFPLMQNEIGSYSFACTVKNTQEVQIEIQLGYTIDYLVECEYLDVNLNPHIINIPLIFSNETTVLASNRAYDASLFFQWTLQDYLDNIYRFYYIEKAEANQKSQYDNPNDIEYQRNPSAKKPVLDVGDEILVSFVTEEGLLVNKTNLVEAHEFSKPYIQEIIGYDNLQEFFKTGLHPEDISTEQENIIIPSFVDFLRDNNI